MYNRYDCVHHRYQITFIFNFSNICLSNSMLFALYLCISVCVWLIPFHLNCCINILCTRDFFSFAQKSGKNEPVNILEFVIAYLLL